MQTVKGKSGVGNGKAPDLAAASVPDALTALRVNSDTGLLRRGDGERLTAWAFKVLKVGDHLKARGPLGQFTMRSRPETPPRRTRHLIIATFTASFRTRHEAMA